MKIKSEDVASKELLNQLKEYSNFLFIENDKIIDTSGNELKIVHLNDKYGFKLMSLYYFYETFNFLEFE